MNRSVKRKRQKRRAGTDGPVLVPHPISRLDPDERAEAVAAIGVAQRDAFAELLPTVLRAVDDLEPLYMLASLATHGVMTSIDRVGEDRYLRGESPIYQSHVEFVQALALRHGAGADRAMVEDRSLMQSLFDALPRLFAAFQQMRMGSLEGRDGGRDDSPAARDPIVALQEHLRGHTLTVRNWASFGVSMTVARDVFRPCDEAVVKALGFALSDVVNLAEFLVRRVERRANAHRRNLHDAAWSESHETRVDRLFAAFPIEETRSYVLSMFRANATSPERTRAMLVNGTERYLPSIYRFDTEEAASELKIDPARLRSMLRSLSLSFGDLADRSPESMFLDNPCWLRPVVALGDDRYFCAIPQSLLSFVHPIVDELLDSHAELARLLAESRARYLESSAERLFAKALPGASIVRGFTWKDEDRRYENDLVVKFGTTMFLVEAKSGSITWPALRGAKDRLKKHVKALIVEPSIQSLRLAKHLKERIARNESDELSRQLGFDVDDVKRIVRLSVTLEDFATVQSNPGLLRDAALVNEDDELALCVMLTDLDAVFDVLRWPYERLHYLVRRAELQKSFKHAGTELDLLGLYLQNGLNVGDAADGRTRYLLVGLSEPIDQYFGRLDEGIAAERPRTRRAPWLQRQCDRLAERGRPGWTDWVCALLRLQPEEQESVRRKLEGIAKRVRRGRSPKDNENSVVVIPRPPDSVAMVFHVYGYVDKDELRAALESISASVFDVPHVSSCRTLAISAVDPELNWSVSVGFRKPDAGDEIVVT